MLDNIKKLHQTTMKDDLPVPQETFTKAYRKHKEIHGWSNRYIAEIIHVTESAAEKWCSGLASPNFESFCSLIYLFGPGFVNDILFSLGMAGVHRVEKEHLSIEQMNTKVSDLAKDFSDAREDNDVDPQEFARIQAGMAELATEIAAFNRHAKPRENR